MTPPPFGVPLGLRLANTTRAVNRAFDDALAAVGGSRPAWLVLMALHRQPEARQRDLAAAVGIGEATVTHHLNAMEEGGFVTRRRDPDNHRAQMVEMTELGEAAFHRMRRAAIDFDRRLRHGVDDDDLQRLAYLLDRLVTNVSAVASEGDRPA